MKGVIVLTNRKDAAFATPFLTYQTTNQILKIIKLPICGDRRA
ncbi:hypothetical protein VDG1235_2290 [Verrucomicrobiia bacterium DG1235]|nr:hypothetical protein VDG1235_2290 [Verrucomicrobiae bacterium DG1235]